MSLRQTLIVLTSTLSCLTLAAPTPQGFDPGPLPEYQSTIRDTSNHPTPFYLRISSTSPLYDGHNLQACTSTSTTPSSYNAKHRPSRGPHAPFSYGSSSANETKDDSSEPTTHGCVDATLTSPVMAFELRSGALYTRAPDPSTSGAGTADEFDTQTLVFASTTSTTTISELTGAQKFALEVTGAYQGVGLYQLVNEAWIGQDSPAGAPFQLGWLMCHGDDGVGSLEYFENAQGRVPVPEGCEIVSLQV